MSDLSQAYPTSSRARIAWVAAVVFVGFLLASLGLLLIADALRTVITD